MDARAAEDTPSLGLKSIPPRARICGCFTAYSDGDLATGGAKGEPGKYLERHSRGRGRITKATRTRWLVALRQYNRHAIAPLFKNPPKLTDAVQTQPECVNSRGHGCLPQVSGPDCRSRC